MSIRITGGIWRGRLLAVPAKNMRPTQDRVRAAVFSSLQGLISGARVLDLFAGTGSYGLEALSRGAEHAIFVENNRLSLAFLRKNVESLLGVEQTEAAGKFNIVASDVDRFLGHFQDGIQVDIIFADPPYDCAAEWTKKILFQLSRRSILKKDGRLVFESRSKSPLVEAVEWSVYWIRSYGETRICVYRQASFWKKSE